MIGGKWRALARFVRRGREVEEGTGQALRDAFSSAALDPFDNPMETEADAAMRRCIELLDELEGTLKGRGET